MGSLLNGLVRLQAVENRLRAAKAKLVRCKRSVVIQENKIKTEETGLNAKKQEIKLTRMQCDRLELELKTRDQEIAKFRAALNTAKTNKEYATLLTQLNTTKADNSKIETQVLELMKEVEVTRPNATRFRPLSTDKGSSWNRFEGTPRPPPSSSRPRPIRSRRSGMRYPSPYPERSWTSSSALQKPMTVRPWRRLRNVRASPPVIAVAAATWASPPNR